MRKKYDMMLTVVNKVQRNKLLCSLPFFALFLFLLGCAGYEGPATRNVDVPAPAGASARDQGVNERPDSVLYLPLGDDLLLPEALSGGGLPADQVGPYEMRGETLAGALQLVTGDYEIPLVFETDEGLTRTVTVSNLKGRLDRVVHRICGLADLYCDYNEGVLAVKERQTFAVSIPPVGGSDFMSALGNAVQAITGEAPVVDEATGTIIYTATSRTAEVAERYFQRLRKNTAMIVFEVYIWEVSLDADNETGIKWSHIQDFGKLSMNVDFPGDFATPGPVSIGLPTSQNDFSAKILRFISTYGAVKTISQPQITMLSGSEATLRVADTRNYVSSITRTVDDNGDVTTSSETDSVDTGFTLTISGAWDNSTVYGNVDIMLEEFRDFKPFNIGEDSSISLPETTERELETQIRIRPGDSLLIAGIIRERDNITRDGLGLMDAIIPMNRALENSNSELVFLLKPRVVVYTSGENHEKFYPNFAADDYIPDFSVNPVVDEHENVKNEVKNFMMEPAGFIEEDELREKVLVSDELGLDVTSEIDLPEYSDATLKVEEEIVDESEGDIIPVPVNVKNSEDINKSSYESYHVRSEYGSPPLQEIMNDLKANDNTQTFPSDSVYISDERIDNKQSVTKESLSDMIDRLDSESREGVE